MYIIECNIFLTFDKLLFFIRISLSFHFLFLSFLWFPSFSFFSIKEGGFGGGNLIHLHSNDERTPFSINHIQRIYSLAWKTLKPTGFSLNSGCFDLLLQIKTHIAYQLINQHITKIRVILENDYLVDCYDIRKGKKESVSFFW